MKMQEVYARLAALLALGGLVLVAAHADTPTWTAGYALPGFDDHVEAFAIAEIEGEPRIVAGGAFLNAGGETANGVAYWDGQRWHKLGTGFTDTVRALATHSGQLYAGGSFPGGVARWNGSSWQTVGAALSDVYALASFNGTLYAGGLFTSGPGVPADFLVELDGSVWAATGAVFNDAVLALHAFDDDSTHRLAVGGAFSEINDQPINAIALFDGTTWSPLGSGLGSGGSAVCQALTDINFGDGAGTVLVAGGAFTQAGALPVSNVACWNGATWQAFGSGVNGLVSALAAFDEDGETRLFVGGSFSVAGGGPAARIARWNGSSWTPLTQGITGVAVPEVHELLAFNDGSGPALYVGGNFRQAGTRGAHHVARWNGDNWDGVPQSAGFNGIVNALTTYDHGNGDPSLYAGGDFGTAGTTVAGFLAQWSGATWKAVPDGPSGGVRALATYDGGSGTELYAGGVFNLAGGETVNRIARWDGATWAELTGGIASSLPGRIPAVEALHASDATGTPLLYVGGVFTAAGGVAANHLATWDGAAWSDPGAAFDDDAQIRAITSQTVDDFTTLYFGGVIAKTDLVSVNNIVSKSGRFWRGVGAGFDGPVNALCSWDAGDDNGPRLYAGGDFSASGATTVRNIACWDGNDWLPVGDGISGPVEALSVWDTPDGSVLVATGQFAFAGGLPVSNIAAWDGTDWLPLGGGLSGVPAGSVDAPRGHVLHLHHDPLGAALFVGGDFARAGGLPSHHVARWGNPPPPVGDLNCDAEADAFDIDAFVFALSTTNNPQLYRDAYPGCDFDLADCNRDGVVDTFDIDGFIAALSN